MIDQRVDLLATLAHGAFVGGTAHITGQVLRIEDRVDGIARAGFHGGEDGADARNRAAVILDRLNRRLSRVARGNRTGEDEHVFALNHGHDIVAEEELTARGVLGRDDVYGLVGVHIGEISPRQLICKAGADDLGAVEAKNGVNNGVCLIVRNKILGNGSCLGKTCFLRGHVDIIVYMAVACGEMTLRNTQKKVVALGSDLISFFSWHNLTPFLLVYHTFFRLSRKNFFNSQRIKTYTEQQKQQRKCNTHDYVGNIALTVTLYVCNLGVFFEVKDRLHFGKLYRRNVPFVTFFI